MRKLVISLIVRRDAHDRARAVVHENVVCHPDGNALSVVRIHREVVSVDAMLFDRANVTYLFGFALLRNQLLNLRAKCIVVFRQVVQPADAAAQAGLR